MNQTPARIDINTVVSDTLHLIADIVKTHPTETRIVILTIICLGILAILNPKEAIKSLPRFK